MKTSLRFIIFVMSILFSLLSNAQEDAFHQLLSTKSLVCEFPSGTSASWKKDSLQIEKDGMKNPIHFDQIDLKENKARMIGAIGSENVTLIVTPGGLSFIETPKSGNIVYITVFPAYLEETKIEGMTEHDKLIKHQLPNAFLAVYSSHLFDSVITKKPIPTQLHGYCRQLE